MTHCLDCGAERIADQCPACGLTSAAAELVLRRRLVKRTAIFLVGIIIFVAASQVYPALEIDAILVFGGLIFFLSLALGYLIDFRARRHQEVEVMKRIYFGMIPVPWIFAALLFLNGKLDNSRPIRVPATVVGKVAIGMFPRSRRLIVTSWRYGRRFEHIAVDQNDFDRFQRGDDIVVQAQKGAVGIPWIYGVFRQ
jgi:amino acid transporter